MSNNSEKNQKSDFLAMKKQYFQYLNVTKLNFRLGLDLSVASHCSEIEEAALLSTLNAKLVTYLRLVLVIYADALYHSAVKWQEIREHIGIFSIIHMSVLVNVAVMHTVAANVCEG